MVCVKIVSNVVKILYSTSPSSNPPPASRPSSTYTYKGLSGISTTKSHKICNAMKKKCYICTVPCIYTAGTQKKKEKQIMAMEIRPIPVVTGDDAKRFVEKAERAEKNPHTVKLGITRAEFDKMMSKAKLS